MTLEEFITQYGYLAVLVGMFLEGETVVTIAGFLAQRGYLNLPLVIAAAMVGAVAIDQSLFFLGRWRGRALLARFPVWGARVDRLRARLAGHETKIVLGFRFAVGFRIITPLVLGSGGYSPGRFVALDFVGVLMWATSFGVLGYVFGEAATRVLGRIQRNEPAIIGALAVAGIGLWLLLLVRARRRARAGAEAA